MDLVDTPEEQVFKRDGRFYCQVHGPLAIIKNNKQQNNFIKKEENFSKNNFSKNILPSKEKFEEQQEWWERSADEFNGSKKSSTIVRFYGEERDKQQTNKNENNGGMFWKSTTTTTSKTTDKQQQTNNYLNKIETKENSNKYLNKNLINSACQVGKYKREEFNKNKFFGQKSNNNNNNNNDIIDDQKLCFCGYCNVELNGSFVLAKGRAWCPEHFCCANSACAKPLMESGFVEDPESRRNYCPKCYEVLLAPICFKCSLPLNESCINALGQKWHPECFFCTHCRKPVGVSSFFVEDGKPYCDDDWNELFTTKCVDCKGPIKVGQKWLEALGGQPFHADCFKCSTCKTILDGKIFFERQNRPYCRTHAIKAAIADSQKITK
uniref:ubiquitinyl hydrolase 1 n=1 Tax=Meloidogyne hapla TaxID=6305 RepID=A0A1I8AY46_MELHA